MIYRMPDTHSVQRSADPVTTSDPAGLLQGAAAIIGLAASELGADAQRADSHTLTRLALEALELAERVAAVAA